MVPYIAPWPEMVNRGIANTAAAGGPLGSVEPVGFACTSSALRLITVFEFVAHVSGDRRWAWATHCEAATVI